MHQNGPWSPVATKDDVRQLTRTLTIRFSVMMAVATAFVTIILAIKSQGL